MGGYLLDSNVLSELRKGRKADPGVQAWLEAKTETEFSTSVICLMELRVGICRALRKDPKFGLLLQEWYDRKVKPAFVSKALPVDLACAETCALLQGRRSLPFRDGLIAATALIHSLTLITRNVRDFTGLGVNVVNPWTT